VLFCIYIDKLLLELSKSGFGCFIGEVFLGALAYADDIVLLAPTHRAMRNMLALCDKFASEYHVVFNARKSKCVNINSCANHFRISATLPHFSLGGNHIAFVDEWPHLGHIITTSRDDKADIISKRNTLCGQINNVLCFLANVLRAYCSCFYGTCHTLPLMLSVPIGARASGASGTFHILAYSLCVTAIAAVLITEFSTYFLRCSPSVIFHSSSHSHSIIYLLSLS